VTLVAHDATVRQILAEWARVGNTRIVNLERVPGGPVSIELTNVPEATALTIVLRSIGGFMAAPRAVADGRLSGFDRIVVMPVLASANVQVASVPAPQRPPAQTAGSFRDRGFGGGRRFADPSAAEENDPGADDGDDDNGADARVPTMLRPPMMRPQFGAPGQPPAAQNENASGAEAATPQAPQLTPGVLTPGGAVARPGQIVPAPPKPPGDTR
jgi:hypothetical protein